MLTTLCSALLLTLISCSWHKHDWQSSMIPPPPGNTGNRGEMVYTSTNGPLGTRAPVSLNWYVPVLTRASASQAPGSWSWLGHLCLLQGTRALVTNWDTMVDWVIASQAMAGQLNRAQETCACGTKALPEVQLYPTCWEPLPSKHIPGRPGHKAGLAFPMPRSP